jgi:uncharacterized protein YlzI (FlbEa/FlbD family)
MNVVSTSGITFHFRPDQVAFITGPVASDKQQVFYIHVWNTKTLRVLGTAESFVENQGQNMNLVQLTQVNGQSVWVNALKVSAVRAITSEQKAMDPTANAAFLLGNGKEHYVEETVANTVNALNKAGSNL